MMTLLMIIGGALIGGGVKGLLNTKPRPRPLEHTPVYCRGEL